MLAINSTCRLANITLGGWRDGRKSVQVFRLDLIQGVWFKVINHYFCCHGNANLITQISNMKVIGFMVDFLQIIKLMVDFLKIMFGI